MEQSMDILSLIPLLQKPLSFAFRFPKMCGIMIFFAGGIICRPPAFFIPVCSGILHGKTTSPLICYQFPLYDVPLWTPG